MRMMSLRGTSVALFVFIVMFSKPLAAGAQGFYYKEIAKDGRIYVFNIAAEAERFEQTGEMGRGITRPGAGPNGETIVGDSERALQLYFFKHGISEVVPEPPQPVQLIEWRDGKTRITTNFAYLELSNRIQVRYTHEFPDDTGPARPGPPRRVTRRVPSGSAARSSRPRAGSGVRRTSRRRPPSSRAWRTSCS